MAAGSNCDGYKDEGITFPSGPQQVKLFRRVAQLAEIDPSTIDFMEAHGSATRVSGFALFQFNMGMRDLARHYQNNCQVQSKFIYVP